MLPMQLEGRGLSYFSAAHMDKINLCVYDRLIYALAAQGASLLVVKLFVIDSFSHQAFSLPAHSPFLSVPSCSPGPQLGLL